MEKNQCKTKENITKENITEKDIKEEEIAKEPIEEKNPTWNKGKIRDMNEHFAKFALLSFFFGLMLTFCLYRNSHGITYPLFIVVAYSCALTSLKLLNMKLKKDSYFVIAIAFLLGISNCLTADSFILGVNRVAQYLLMFIFILHQFYDDWTWNIGKYLGAVCNLFFTSFGTIFIPWYHGMNFLKYLKVKKYRNIVLVLVGLVAAIPLLIIMGLLLGAADAVFGDMLMRWIGVFLNPLQLFEMIFMTVFGSWSMYCLMCGACMKNINPEIKYVRRKEPLIAATAMGMVALLYLLFCGIQIIYLFMGKGALPEGMTYSSYARQGFFQLITVAFLNLIMVLLCLKYFRENRILNLVLSVISGCTYVMIISAFYRMILYVLEYRLTYLRVLVLWFLGLLTILLAGVIILIYKNQFQFFKFCLVVVSVFYVSLAFLRPDRVIAEYNTRDLTQWTDHDSRYLENMLSADAAPVIYRMIKGEGINLNYKHFYNKREMRDPSYTSFRQYNFSYGKARKLYSELNK